MLAFVMRRLDGISRSKAKAILSSGGVIVDDKVQTRHDFAVKPDMEVKIITKRVANALSGNARRWQWQKRAEQRSRFQGGV